LQFWPIESWCHSHGSFLAKFTFCIANINIPNCEYEKAQWMRTLIWRYSLQEDLSPLIVKYCQLRNKIFTWEINLHYALLFSRHFSWLVVKARIIIYVMKSTNSNERIYILFKISKKSNNFPKSKLANFMKIFLTKQRDFCGLYNSHSQGSILCLIFLKFVKLWQW